MQFLVLGFDGLDDHALERRLAAREAHLRLGDELMHTGNLLYGVAILDDGGKMVGSCLVCDFPARADVDAWLEREPYVTRGVWQRVEVRACAVGPSFRHLIDAARG